MIPAWNDCSSKIVGFTLIILRLFQFQRNNVEMSLVGDSLAIGDSLIGP